MEPNKNIHTHTKDSMQKLIAKCKESMNNATKRHYIMQTMQNLNDNKKAHS